MRRCVLLVCAWSAMALAQAAKPSVVVAPLELDPNPALTRFDLQLKQAFFSTVDERSGALVVTKKEADAALRETKRQDFRESDESLARLAEKAGTLYAVYGWLEYTPKKQLVLTGRVVRDDGKLMKSAQVQLPKGSDSFEAALKPLTLQWLTELGVAALPSFKEVVAKPVEQPPTETAKVVDPPPPLPPVIVDSGAGQRTAGQGVLGVGIGVAVVGGVLFGIGQGIGGALTPVNGSLPPEQVGDFRAATGLCTAGVVTMGVGAAAAVVGAVLWGTAPAPVTMSASPTNGGAMFSLQGSF